MAKKMTFGKVQLRIMHILWERTRATAREITDDLNKISPIAHSTVQTLLRKLEEKGAVNHDVQERTFFFFPLVPAEQVKRNGLKDFMERMFSGSPVGLVSYLIKNEDISDNELNEIRELVKNKKD